MSWAEPPDAAPPDVLCIGAVLWDLIGHAGHPMARGDDRPGRIRRQPGGVALNTAVVLRRFGLRPALLGALGEDGAGDALVAAIDALAIGTGALLRMPGLPTDRYMAIEDAQGLVAALADTGTLEAAETRILSPLADGRLAGRDAPWTGPVVLDSNLTPAFLEGLMASGLLASADLRLVPAGLGKATRLVPLMRAPRATLYVNLAEARLMLDGAPASAAEAAEALVSAGAGRALVTDGARGAAEARRGAPVLTCDAPPVAPVRVTGAGDTFLAAHLAAELSGAAPDAALAAAARAAALHVSGKDPA